MKIEATLHDDDFPDAVLTADEPAVVEFTTRGRSPTARGTGVRNLATATAPASAPDLVGPAESVVGKQASLHRTLKTVEVLDSNGNEPADPGEELRYTIAVHNDGGSAARTSRKHAAVSAGRVAPTRPAIPRMRAKSIRRGRADPPAMMIWGWCSVASAST